MRFALFYHSLVSDWNHGNDDAEMKRHLHGATGRTVCRRGLSRSVESEAEVSP